MDDQKRGWASGRVRESVDGLRTRPGQPQDERRLREAAERERQQAQNRMREVGHADADNDR